MQKVWLGNDCPINVSDASSILQYKHFACECTIVGLTGVWLGQYFEWLILSNKGRINQSPWLWHITDVKRILLRLILAIIWFALHALPFVFGPSAASFEMSEDGSNFILGILICFMLPAFFIGFNTFAFLRFIVYKVKLDNSNAIGKEFI